jgi:hypothetical protein
VRSESFSRVGFVASLALQVEDEGEVEEEDEVEVERNNSCPVTMSHALCNIALIDGFAEGGLFSLPSCTIFSDNSVAR